MFAGKKIKALFFDMDGTLINTVPWLFKAYCDVKQQLGQTPNPTEFYQLNGASISEIATALQLKDESKDQIARQLVAARDRYLPCKAHLFAGVREFLTLCKEENVVLWLVTSASHKVANQMLQHCEILSLFQGLVTSEEINLGKPHPEIYLKALERAKVSKAQALAFEDSAQGITSALKAGLSVVSFNSDYRIQPSHECNQNLLGHFHRWSDIKKWFFQMVD